MDSAKDKSGKTLEQFLHGYDVTKYFRPSVTADAVLCRLTDKGGKILLIKRGGHPFIGDWAFPGGFTEQGESCETTAARELYEETGITAARLSQLVTVSTPGRDPRWQTVSTVFYEVTDGDIAAVGSDDAAEARWLDFECEIGGETAVLTLSADGRDISVTKLKIVRDAAGRIDLNNTQITDRGHIAFDHAKIICYLYEVLRGLIK